MQETQVQSLGQEEPLKKEMATHSSILAWKIPRREEPSGHSPWGHKESELTEDSHMYNSFYSPHFYFINFLYW